jgi:phosphoglycolate phosphatase
MNGLVMCDYDGVIVDSLEVFSSVFMAACNQCGCHTIDSRGRLMNLFDGNLFEGMIDLGLDAHTIEWILAAFQAQIGAHLHKVKMFEGMAAALKIISRHNTVVIITSNLSPTVRQVLGRYGVDCVEDILGAEKEKSKVRKIRQTMERYSQRSAYYIGDTLGDIIEGRKAGASTVAVAWGWHDQEKLRRGSPDFMVTTLRELTKLFENHEKGATDGSQ